MNLPDFVGFILNFISRWAGVTAPRIVVAFLGTLICVLIVIAIWDRRIRILQASIGLLIGLLMIAFAIEPRVLHALAATGFLIRIRILMSILSFVVLVITVEAVRRQHLQERYALLWIATGLIILLTAFLPQVLGFFSLVLGAEYVTSVVGIVFTFLLLIGFHFSIALSGFQKKQTRIAQRCAILEERIAELTRQLNPAKSETNKTQSQPAILPEPMTPDSDEHLSAGHSLLRRFKGTQVAVVLIILLAFISVLVIGLLTPQAMIGDEVTHFFMLTKQSSFLSQPNFYAEIPTEYGETEVRRYPHTFLWHYLGAIVYRLTGGAFCAVQIYQSIFLVQLLIVAYLFSKSRRGIETRSAIIYILVLASLPVCLIFSVIFYQDVPMTAQVLTVFYLLRKRRWLAGSLFMCLAIGFKETAMLFLPAFFVLMIIWEVKANGWLRSGLVLICSGLIVLGSMWGIGRAIKTYSGSGFYPEEKLEEVVKSAKRAFSLKDRNQVRVNTSKTKKLTQQEQSDSFHGLKPVNPYEVTPYEVEIIANHPGDLRLPENYLVYGGSILWIIILAGVVSMVCSRMGMKCSFEPIDSGWWLWFIGLSYMIMAAYFLRTAPDARFFLPGLPFVVLPVVEKAVRLPLPKPKLFIALIASLAILQSGYVLFKTYKLRRVTPEIREAIQYLKQNPPFPRLIFMYPEGNYRLFPIEHEWYLDYLLRKFWKLDNDDRIRMLYRFGVGAIVIKKHLIAEVDSKITNLGVYPKRFVRDLENDPRFEKVFENAGVIIYRVPVTPEIRETIQYLEQNPPSPPLIFMCPPGSKYPLLPVPHEWYLDGLLDSFWKLDNDGRIQMLHKFGVGAIVILKHLIAKEDSKIIEFVYPTYFVRDLENDPRFEKVFENTEAIIYRVP